MIIKKDSKIVKAKVERKSLALKAKKESSDEECLTFRSKHEEYAMTVKDFKKFFKRRGNQKLFSTYKAYNGGNVNFGSNLRGNIISKALWMKQALIDYDDVPIMCDNKGANDLSKNPVQHSRTKHIKIRHHFLRDNVQKGHISIEKVPSFDNIADILTKPLKRESFNYLRLGLGMMEHIP
uniref:Copia protein n=1 Tax=Tanacetum cinerariifolium TaxID=118510 RepID=A0A6L2L1E2_TANCI|nr:copia protein [Tanacetum cinerariifolium]